MSNDVRSVISKTHFFFGFFKIKVIYRAVSDFMEKANLQFRAVSNLQCKIHYILFNMSFRYPLSQAKNYRCDQANVSTTFMKILALQFPIANNQMQYTTRFTFSPFLNSLKHACTFWYLSNAHSEYKSLKDCSELKQIGKYVYCWFWFN